MGEFHAFAIGGEEDRVVADDIATAQRVHPDFARFARADVAEAAMGDVVLVGRAGFLVEDFKQAAGSAGWGVDLVLVVHFRDLDVEAFLRENTRGLASEPEERVHPDRVVCGINDADGFRGFVNDGTLCIGMAGGADDEAGAVFQGGFHEWGGE